MPSDFLVVGRGRAPLEEGSELASEERRELDRDVGWLAGLDKGGKVEMAMVL